MTDTPEQLRAALREARETIDCLDEQLARIARERDEARAALATARDALAAIEKIEMPHPHDGPMLDNADEGVSYAKREALKAINAAFPQCPRCEGAEWVDEANTGNPWAGVSTHPRATAQGAGDPCPDCNPLAMKKGKP